MPDRKKFYEEINERLHAVVSAAMEEFPELQGAAIALAYSPEIGDPPAWLLLGDLERPGLLYQLTLQTAKLQTMVGQNIAHHINKTMRAHAEMRKEIDDRRRLKDAQGTQEEEGDSAGAGQFGRAPGAPEDH